jgi:phosphatidylserine decarboxylase
MNKTFFPLAAEGRRLLVIELGWATALSALLYFLSPQLLPAAAALFLAAMAFTLFFFRDPVFVPQYPEPGIILSPSYGTVLKTGLEDGRPVVRIFLSVLDVHAQYSPVTGTVRSTAMAGDNFFRAFLKEAAQNRRNLIEIDLAGGKTLGVEQIAGSIARRIACCVKTGENLVPGSRLGLIYFGSQVAVYLPPGAEILARPGLPVKPCSTILARL